MRLLALLFISSINLPALAELPADYQSWSAAEKQTYLWEDKIVPTKWDELPPLKGLGWDGILKSLKSVGSLGTSFDHVSDELPASRTKLLHPYGAVATVELVSDPNQPFSGIYGGAIGMARLSLAGDPSGLGYTPGMGLKFFIDGKPSVNLHVMEKLNGQGEDQNFFANTFTNNLPEPEGFALNAAAWFFGLFVDNPLHLNISHLAQTDRFGNSMAMVASPYQVFFEPVADVQISSDTTEDYRVELEKIPAGSVLYTVWGSMGPEQAAVYIGELRTTSSFVSSHYGDHTLFFQHQR